MEWGWCLLALSASAFRFPLPFLLLDFSADALQRRNCYNIIRVLKPKKKKSWRKQLAGFPSLLARRKIVHQEQQKNPSNSSLSYTLCYPLWLLWSSFIRGNEVFKALVEGWQYSSQRRWEPWGKLCFKLEQSCELLPLCCSYLEGYRVFSSHRDSITLWVWRNSC